MEQQTPRLVTFVQQGRIAEIVHELTAGRCNCSRLRTRLHMIGEGASNVVGLLQEQKDFDEAFPWLGGLDLSDVVVRLSTDTKDPPEIADDGRCRSFFVSEILVGALLSGYLSRGVLPYAVQQHFAAAVPVEGGRVRFVSVLERVGVGVQVPRARFSIPSSDPEAARVHAPPTGCTHVTLYLSNLRALPCLIACSAIGGRVTGHGLVEWPEEAPAAMYFSKELMRLPFAERSPGGQAALRSIQPRLSDILDNFALHLLVACCLLEDLRISHNDWRMVNIGLHVHVDGCTSPLRRRYSSADGFRVSLHGGAHVLEVPYLGLLPAIMDCGMAIAFRDERLGRKIDISYRQAHEKRVQESYRSLRGDSHFSARDLLTVSRALEETIKSCFPEEDATSCPVARWIARTTIAEVAAAQDPLPRAMLVGLLEEFSWLAEPMPAGSNVIPLPPVDAV